MRYSCFLSVFLFNQALAAIDPPPKLPPFQLPLLNEVTAGRQLPAPLASVNPGLHAREIYLFVKSCYPMPSRFPIDISFVASASNKEISTSSINNLDATTQGKYYAGIVAKMPIWSDSEIERIKQIELKIHQLINEGVAQYLQAINMLIQSHRQLGLYSSLESRSQVRVRTGVADTSEQVNYLDKTIQAQTAVAEWEMKLDAARVGLSGLCTNGDQGLVNDYLEEYAIERGLLDNRKKGNDKKGFGNDKQRLMQKN